MTDSMASSKVGKRFIFWTDELDLMIFSRFRGISHRTKEPNSLKRVLPNNSVDELETFK